MSVVPGDRLGAYEIVEPLGAGGMGEVYRARDPRLGRDVAIKMLPAAFALDADRRARFEREARVLASLNHPNIAILHGVEDSAMGTVLVMELVEGETLADRISLGARGRGGVPLREALAIASQLAAALDAAHGRGIVHRDLKPANIVVRPDGTVKVLDFGLAKALAPEGGSADDAVTMTTETPGKMGPGTPAYMSPEQARGQTIDKRTDVWAFGCVLYELLAGRRPFGGDTTSDVLAGILERDPDFTALPRDTPDSIQRLLHRCLQKDPQDRMRDIGDVRLELREAATVKAEGSTAEPPRSRSQLGWLAAVAAISVTLTASTLALAWWRGYLGPPSSRAAEEQFVRLETMLPSGVSVTRGPGLASSVAVSPDGRAVVIAGTGPDGQRLYRRSLESTDPVPIAGTDGGSSPFFSWDGKWIGFFADGQLKRIPAEGGPAIDIVRLAGFPGGASWGPDDRIVFGYGAAAPLYIVDARGGQPAALINTRAGHLPEVGPDGRTVLYASSDQWVYAFDRTTGRETRLTRGTAPRFAAGHIVFARAATLLAAPFDLSRHELTGAEFPVVDGVAPERGTTGGMAHYALSRTGTLAYVPDAGAHSLVLVRPDGSERTIGGEQQLIHNPRFSPKDGRRVVFGARRREAGRHELWVHDLETDITSQLTSDGGSRPVWIPDGTSVTYSRTGGLYVKPADGRGDSRPLVGLENFHWLIGWTPDARTFAYAVMQGTPAVVMALTDGRTRQIIGPASTWGGRLSPDGRWLVYYSLDSGSFEVLVTPFPDGGNRWTIAEGTDPTWSPDGNEIYFRRGTRLMAVRIDKTAGIRVVGTPRIVIDPFLPPLYDDYDVHPDGRTLVHVRPVGALQPRQVEVVVSWFGELRRLARASQ